MGNMNLQKNVENIFDEKVKEEFEQFLKSPEINPPQYLSEKILSEIHSKLVRRKIISLCIYSILFSLLIILLCHRLDFHP